VVQVKPPGDRPQSELWSKTRDLAPGDVSDPARLCVVELSPEQNPVGWHPVGPSVPVRGLEPAFTW